MRFAAALPFGASATSRVVVCGSVTVARTTAVARQHKDKKILMVAAGSKVSKGLVTVCQLERNVT